LATDPTGECNDTDPYQHPGQVWYIDSDGDDYSSGSSLVQCADPGANYYYSGQLIAITGDCDDTDDTVYSGATELCDGLDNDCDTVIDDDVEMYDYYLDSDSDGYGTSSISTSSCSDVTGYVLNSGDCNDSSAILNPLTLWYVDADGDDYSSGSYLQQCLDP